MSNTTKVAKRYAQGLLDFTTETSNTETVFNEMKDVAETISGSKELRSFFRYAYHRLQKKAECCK